MNESEQAQAIAEIDAMISNWSAYCIGSFVNACENLRDLVDSQAQKIAEQAMQIEKLAGLNHVAEAQIERQAMQIAKQAKEIERLKDRLRFEMQPEAKEGL